MDEERDSDPRFLDVRPGQPLIGVPFLDGDVWVTRYFASEADARAFGRDTNAIERVLGAPCEQTEEEFHDMLDELDRIRHRNPPTPLPEPFP